MGQLSCSVCNTNIWETVGWDSCRVQCVIPISGRQWGGMGQLSCSVCNTNIWETVGWDGTAVVFSV